MNRLAKEKSPYLRQHADNPVAWYPWGDEAFAQARAEGKPIFLSIGYSTCHWCHVMERESFQDERTAAELNASFVAVKVDREERPDVDRLYMTAANSAGWGGGWPLNLFLTPGCEPFYGGTYFPPEPRWGRPSFVEILRRVAGVWKKERAGIEADAARFARQFAAAAAAEPERVEPQAGWPGKLTARLRAAYDAECGGFGGAPKFPMPPTLRFLLSEHARSGDPGALEAAAGTLAAMGRGGICDQLGGGFHRYAVDAEWRVPHFEKMLYDNAQLATVLLETHLASGDEEAARLARETLDYLLRDLERPGGGFYSAEDADSFSPGSTGTGKSEGAFYLWTASELREVLGPGAKLFMTRYGVREEGNAPEDPHGEFAGRNILFAARGVMESAVTAGISEAEARCALDAARKTLFERRALRPRPQRDEKLVAAWNGLALSAFAQGAQSFEEPRYLAAGERAARFLLAELYDPAGRRLKRRWADGAAGVDGLAEDYACLAQGLLDLFSASFEPEWLERALELQTAMEDRFGDGKGGYSQTPKDGGRDLFAALGTEREGVEPAAASVAASNLLRLARALQRPALEAAARRVLERHGAVLRDAPEELPLMMAALGFALAKPRQLVVAGPRGDPVVRAMLRLARSRARPPITLLVVEPGAQGERLVRLNPLLRGMVPAQGRPAAYLCADFACVLPTCDLGTLGRLLAQLPQSGAPDVRFPPRTVRGLRLRVLVAASKT